MKDAMALCATIGGGQCICLKSNPTMKIASMEDWQCIVEAAHINPDHGTHKSEKETINSIKAEWCIDIKRHGIPIEYVKDWVLSCGCQLIQPKVSLQQPTSKKQSKSPSKIMVTEWSTLSQDLVDIMVQHTVRLVFLCSTKNSGPFEIVQELICHRGGNVYRRGSNKRRLRKSKRCGCPFKVVLQYACDSNKVNILLYDIHEGHVPGTRADLYYLPIHPRVISCCMDDFFDVGTCRHVAKMSVSKENFHIQNSSPLDHVVFRFFMISKEVQMLSYQMRRQGHNSSDDWVAMYLEALSLKEENKVIYVQPYNHAINEDKRPFILTIQDQWMLEVAIRFSPNNSWAVDSTFKTNVFGLPLYAAVLPNQNGVGIPIWLMLRTSDVATNQESVALELTFKLIFSRMHEIRPAAIVIDKHPMELNVIQKVPKEKRDHVYDLLCNLMQAHIEQEFEEIFQSFLLQYSSHLNVCRYVSNGWCGHTCIWRECWFGHLFPHGNVDTTNLVERLWQ